VWLFVLEGQGRTLDEIDTMHILRVLPWKSSIWIIPERTVHDEAVWERMRRRKRKEGRIEG